ncbi:MAG: NifB/NifX family molybdenum-iron cluster-binding protein [Synergistaceae bacterium]|nr:NifB/NifX family molybdenum-iron cluster-binding protein [Synergistaceae bacterium]
MRIAATFDSNNGEIFQHFGKTQHFRIYDTDGQTVTHAQTIGTDGKGHGQLAPYLKAQGVEAVICGGVGAGMQEALTGLGIKFYAGVSGDPDEAVNELLAGKLVYDQNPHCGHHEHGGEHHHG